MISLFQKTEVFLFTLCLLIRLAVVWTIPEIRVSSDSLEYLQLADSLDKDGSFSRDGQIETYRTPGYPFFLFVLRKIFGSDQTRWIASMQALLSALSAMLVFRLTKCAFGRDAANLAAVLIALNPGDGYCVTSILTESLFAFTLIGLAAVWRFRPFPVSYFNFLLCGILVGVATLIRPVAVLLFIPLTGLLAFRTQTLRSTAAQACAFLIGVGCVQGTWMVRNYAQYGVAYLSEISSADLYVFWAQAAISRETGENRETRYENAWKEWEEAKTQLTPPQMKDEFRDQALRELVKRKRSVGILWIEGAVRQWVDSTLMKLLLRYNPRLPLGIGDLKTHILHPNGFRSFLLSLGIAFARVAELLLVFLLFVGAFQTLIQVFFSGRIPADRFDAIFPAVVIVVYLFLLSSGPPANFRFREQYADLLIFLASPALISWGTYWKRICWRVSASICIPFQES